jgi:hypothetical protein
VLRELLPAFLCDRNHARIPARNGRTLDVIGDPVRSGELASSNDEAAKHAGENRRRFGGHRVIGPE